MSSTTTAETYEYITRQINIYFGFFIASVGLIGFTFNVSIFTTLRTFRQTVCAFYLTMVAIVNGGQSITVLIRTLRMFRLNSLSSSVVCKMSLFLSQYCALTSLTFMCLCTIGQFLSFTNYRHWNNMQTARRHVVATLLVWFVHGIFTLIYYSSNNNACVITNPIFAKYYTYVYLLVLHGVLPLTIMIIFSLLPYFQIRSVASRQINIIPLGRDRQLTAMTLCHVLFTVVTLLPFVVLFAYTLTVQNANREEMARNQMIMAPLTLLAFAGYACSFYIYCCVSKRFRNQLIHVLIRIYCTRPRDRPRNVNVNQVRPQIIELTSQQLKPTSLGHH